MKKLRLEQKRNLINLIRTFFSERDFFELETPLLVPSPGMEVYLHAFKTKYWDHQNRVLEYYLPTSPEFSIKKALAHDFEKVFEIARVFRNHGEMGSQHHPEFNMLEWYRPGNYEDIMDDVEALLGFLNANFATPHKRPGFSWDSDIKRSSIQTCFEHYASLDLERGMNDPEYWRKASEEAIKASIPEDDSFEDIFFRVWLKLIEANLGVEQAEIVYDYPASMAALSKLKAPDSLWAERFELYIQGVEIGNAFSELTDPGEQRRRFLEANAERVKLGYPKHPVDEELIESVGKMTETGGIAVGLERLLMVLTGAEDIREFFLQPLGETIRK